MGEGLKYMSEKSLWQHQQKVVDDCKDRNYFSLHWEMGCGKSAAVIHILRGKYRQEKRFLRTLILVPLSVIQQFAKEFVKFGGLIYSKQVLAVTGTTKQQKLKQIATHKGAIIIINHDSLNVPELLKALWEFNAEAVIVDEGHKFKEPTASRTKKLLGLVRGNLVGHKYFLRMGKRIKMQTILGKLPPAKYRFTLTGTPILNSILDLYSQAKILSDDIFKDESYYAFWQRYMTNVNASNDWASFPKFVAAPGAVNEVSKIIRCLLYTSPSPRDS